MIYFVHLYHHREEQHRRASDRFHRISLFVVIILVSAAAAEHSVFPEAAPLTDNSEHESEIQTLSYTLESEHSILRKHNSSTMAEPLDCSDGFKNITLNDFWGTEVSRI